MDVLNSYHNTEGRVSDAAITAIVAGLAQIVVVIAGVVTLWVKLKYGADEAQKKALQVEKKIDQNTEITKAGTSAAAINAKTAATCAAEAKKATESVVMTIEKKMNGGVDVAIEAAIKPIRETLTEHILRYEIDMKAIISSLKELHSRVGK